MLKNLWKKITDAFEMVLIGFLAQIVRFINWAFFDTNRHLKKGIKKAKKRGVSDEKIDKAVSEISDITDKNRVFSSNALDPYKDLDNTLVDTMGAVASVALSKEDRDTSVEKPEADIE